MNDQKIVDQEVKQRAEKHGYKEANLHQLAKLSETLMAAGQLSFRVPAWISLSTDDNDAFLSAYRDAEGISFDALYQEYCSLQTKELSTQQILDPEAANLLEKMSQFILKAYAEKMIQIHPDVLSRLQGVKKLMVRSTGKEDNNEIANPGGNASFKFVENTPDAISLFSGQVISSYASPKSIMQRLLGGDDITAPFFMPVLIQEMIGISEDPSACVRSGVMYTSQYGHQIQVAPGHGELIVNSRAPFDSYFVSSGSIVYSDIHEKPVRLGPIGDAFIINPKNIRFSPSISASVVRRMEIIGNAIQAHYGEPRDIEFAYDPIDDEISIFQSRPIPSDKVNTVFPSSVSPHKLAEVKKTAIAIVKGIVITPAKKAAKILTESDQVIEKETLTEALNHYLHILNPEQRKKIKAVVVRQEAARTSHEAAQFNSWSIPVLALDDDTFCSKQFEKTKSCAIIIDPQRSQVIAWPCETLVNVEEQLFHEETGILNIGIFKSSMPARQSLLTGEFDNGEPQSFHEFFEFLNRHIAEKEGEVQKEALPISALIEIIESTRAKQDNLEQLNSLTEILKLLVILYRKHPEKMQGLSRQALNNCLDIYRKIKIISDGGDAVLEKSHQQELLDLTSKLSGLVFYPGRRGVLSSSVSQELTRVQQENESRVIVRSVLAKMGDSQKAYNIIRLLRNRERFSILVDTLKFGKLAANEMIEEKWQAFVVAISVNSDHAVALATLIARIENNDLSGEWMNKLFVSFMDLSPLETLRKLINNSNTFLEEMDRLQLDKAERFIAEWEGKVSEWPDPAKFDQLYLKFKACFSFIHSLSYESTHHDFTKIKILRLVKRMTEMLDESIKALKGSPLYASDDRVIQRAKHMAMMLAPMNTLMAKWLGYQGEVYYSNISKAQVTQAIISRYLALSQRVNSIALTVEESKRLTLPGKSFSLESLVYRPGADIRFNTRDFEWIFNKCGNDITLEDIYTLMHQNIMNALIRLAPCYSDLISPVPVQQFVEIFRETHLEGGDYIQSGGVSCSGPYFNQQGLYYDFHCTLGKHQFTMTLAYNKSAQSVLFDYLIVDGGGGDEHGRYTDIAQMIKFLHRYLQSACPQFEIVSNNSGYHRGQLSFSVRFSIDGLTVEVISVIHRAISLMGLRTYSDGARKGKLFLPEEYALTSADLFMLIENNCGSQIIPEVAIKIKGAINDRNPAGDSAIFLLLASSGWTKNKKVCGLLSSPYLDYHQQSSNGQSLLNCIRTDKIFYKEYFANLLQLAMYKNDGEYFEMLLLEPNIEKLIPEFFEFLSDIIHEYKYAKSSHNITYLKWQHDLIFTLIGRHQLMQRLLTYGLNKDEKLISSIRSCRKSLGCLIEIYSKNTKSHEKLAAVLASPLCGSESFVSKYENPLWAAAVNEAALKMIMDTGLVTDEVISRSIKKATQYVARDDSDGRFQRLESYLGCSNVVKPK